MHFHITPEQYGQLTLLDTQMFTQVLEQMSNGG
jgi:hypothetical protein